MTSRVESIRYNGIIYRRYPDAQQHSDRVYYVAGIGDRQRGYKRLHEDIWRAHNGDIPTGHHIHHADHDPDNNNPDNLICLTAQAHQDYHADDRRGWCSEERAEHLAAIRPKAAEWHRSDVGRAWHVEHGRTVWARREPDAHTCEQCGTEYDTLSKHGGERFCSNKCKSAWRRAAGLDDEQRACECCAAPFVVNRYSKVRFCSRSHAIKHTARRSCSCH